MKVDQVSQQIDALRRRVSTLYCNAGAAVQTHEVIPKAFEELQLALDVVQALHNELHQQHEHLMDVREELGAERQTYADLFTQAPVAYLLIGPNGSIRKANQAAASLLRIGEKGLVGRALALFVPEGGRRAFRAALESLQHGGDVQTIEAQMQPWEGPPFDAALTFGVVRGTLGRPLGLRCLIQDISERKRGEALLRARLAALEPPAD